MSGRDKDDFEGFSPLHDNQGRLGRPYRRWHEIWGVSIRGTDSSYLSGAMTGDETFTDPLNPIKTYVLDPNGATRKFTPSGLFNAGFVALIKNIGTDYAILFDPEGSKQTIGPGQVGLAFYDGTVWR